jgi:hypothetical protein
MLQQPPPSSSPFQTPWSNPFNPPPSGMLGDGASGTMTMMPSFGGGSGTNPMFSGTFPGGGGADNGVGGGGMGESLLGGQQQQDGSNEYNMNEYFMTFVRDIYGLFMQLHVVVRVVVVVGLLYVAFRLL